jgi:DNA-binding NtrC family response regulator
VPEREPIIAVVDDDVSMLRALRRLLRSVGITVVTYTSVEEFLQSGLRGRIRCLVLDVMMPRMSGLDLLARLDASAVILLVIINTINTACADEQTRLCANLLKRKPCLRPFGAPLLATADTKGAKAPIPADLAVKLRADLQGLE